MEKIKELAVVVHCNACGATKSWDAGNTKQPIYWAGDSADRWAATHRLACAIKRAGNRA